MRSFVASVLEVAGAAVTSVGVGLMWPPAGVVTAGAWLVVFGYQAGES